MSSSKTLIRLDNSEHQGDRLQKWWDIMTSSEHRYIHQRIGNLQSSFSIKPDWNLLRAAIYYWDPTRMVFSFGPHELTPTIEELDRIIGLSTYGHNIVIPELGTSPYSALKKLTALPHAEFIKNSQDGSLPFSFFEQKYKGMGPDTANTRARVFILLVLGFILLPDTGKSMNMAMAQLALQIDEKRRFSTLVLSEMFASFTEIRTIGRGRLRGSPILLHIWLVSHITSLGNHLGDPVIVAGKNMMQNFVEKVGNDFSQSTQYWVDFFAQSHPKDFIWTARWMPHVQYISGPEPSGVVPLIGYRHITAYQPSRVIRQLGSIQTIFPAPDFSIYSMELSSKKVAHRVRVASIVKTYSAWKKVTLRETPSIDLEALSGSSKAYRATSNYIQILSEPRGISDFHTHITPSNPGPSGQSSSNDAEYLQELLVAERQKVIDLTRQLERQSKKSKQN